MPDYITIRTARNVEIEYRLASIGDRILGRIIDSFILIGYLIMLGFFYTTTGMLFLTFILALPAIFYTFIFERFNNGQTPGKNIVKTRVISLQGDNVSSSMYFLRWIMLLVDLRLVSGVIGIVAILVSDESQRLGDMVAGTAVISLKKSKGIEHTGYRKINPNYEPSFPKAINLKEQDVQTLQAVLSSQANKKSEMMDLAAEKIEKAYDIPTSGDSRQFLRTLVNDYNYYQYHAYQESLGKYEDDYPIEEVE